MTLSDDSVLDTFTASALAGPHAALAERCGSVVRYRPDVAAFVALPRAPTEDDWDAVRHLTGPSAPGLIAEPGLAVPDDLITSPPTMLTQWTATDPLGASSPDAVQLGSGELDEVLDLVARTDPGPFARRTMEMGTYLGIRRDGHLAALAGERLRAPGFTEISAVCTDPRDRGDGLAREVVQALAAQIEARGDRCVVHILNGNEPSERLFTGLGFTRRVELPAMMLIGQRQP